MNWFKVVFWGVGVLAVLSAEAQEVHVIPDFVMESADDCFEGTLEWPAQVALDGYDWVQFKYYNYTTGYKVYERGEEDRVFSNTDWPPSHDTEAISIDSELLSWDVGTCGLGMWSYQIRYGYEDAEGYHVWGNWEQYVVIKIELPDPDATQPPYQFALYGPWARQMAREDI